MLGRLGDHCVDATACVGGMTRILSQFFTHVTAIEIDETRYTFLKNNMHVLECKNVECIHGDCMVMCPMTDVIVLDPPWGGRKYKTLKSVDLYMNDKSLCTICDTLSLRTRYIAIKVPLNFNVSGFERDLSYCVVNSTIHLEKMNVLILKTCPLNM